MYGVSHVKKDLSRMIHEKIKETLDGHLLMLTAELNRLGGLTNHHQVIL